jgi:hypothetical protein
MATRDAACHCGQLRLEVEGDPFAVSICNCRACQRRTGSAFGIQAGFKADQVQVAGRFGDYSRVSDEADRKEHVFHFCPDCGSQVFYTEPTEPDLVVVSVGSFSDPSFPPPTESVYDSWRHPWVGLPDSIQRPGPDVWDSMRPLYDAGRYAEAADKGRELIEDHPDDGQLYYNTACCESLAGEPAHAVEHLRRAIEMWAGGRDMARGDSDFDPIATNPHSSICSAVKPPDKASSLSGSDPHVHRSLAVPRPILSQEGSCELRLRVVELSALQTFEPKMCRGMRLRPPATIPSAPLVVRQRLTLAIPAWS